MQEQGNRRIRDNSGRKIKTRRNCRDQKEMRTGKKREKIKRNYERKIGGNKKRGKEE